MELLLSAHLTHRVGPTERLAVSELLLLHEQLRAYPDCLVTHCSSFICHSRLDQVLLSQGGVLPNDTEARLLRLVRHELRERSLPRGCRYSATLLLLRQNQVLSGSLHDLLSDSFLLFGTLGIGSQVQVNIDCDVVINCLERGRASCVLLRLGVLEKHCLGSRSHLYRACVLGVRLQAGKRGSQAAVV